MEQKAVRSTSSQHKEVSALQHFDIASKEAHRRYLINFSINVPSQIYHSQTLLLMLQLLQLLGLVLWAKVLFKCLP